ncbi:hypothetical protein M407DRAFT_31117 [Tulasnella calospora MUT 4182]|uniref:Ubiquitin-like protease family profile domain-containing protein n=1 Tax=Tulasnella calospora MUT 4182 TaxID=1051891 RepID=A0A0C3Q652_9AGAM|nr:hypothetical protein M407DRAFT_31117 [Tulasnella calospora MUT 4182]
MSSSVIDYSSDGPLGEVESDCDGDTFEDEERARGDMSSPILVENASTPPPLGVVLRYKGYLDFKHEVYRSDLDSLQNGEELNGRLMDMLLALAHAQMTEDQPTEMANVLVLPTTFGEALLRALGSNASVTSITQASQRISRYHERFWKSRLILIPIQHQHHWILAAITNPHLARDCMAVKPPSQFVHNQDTRPDVSPFCILAFNSLRGSWSVAPLMELLKEFMRYLWSAIHGGVLEHLDSYNVKCPQQLDVVSCGLYVIGFGEALMRAGVSERVRRSAQVW